MTDIAGLIADLSHYNTSVDLAAMKSGGIAAVILKASEGTTFTDPTFASRAAAASAAGLLVGAYHFYSPGVDPTAQASYFLGIARAAGVSVLAVDFEPSTAGTDEANAAIMCLALHDATGRWPLLYTGRWDVSPANKIFSEMPLWIAAWTTAATPALPPGFSSWQLWQFESVLNAVPGVVGACSRSRFNGDLAGLQAWWTPPAPEPSTITATVTDTSGTQWSGKLTKVLTHSTAMLIGAGSAGYIAMQQPAPTPPSPAPIIAQASVPPAVDYVSEFQTCCRAMQEATHGLYHC